MKLVSLATWGGRVGKPLFTYIKEQSTSTDIFCFQEILKGGTGTTQRGESKSMYEDIAAVLPDHTGYFFEYGEGGYFSQSSESLDFEYGIACFVRNNLTQSFGEGVQLYDPKRKWSDYSGEFAAGTSFAVLVEGYVVVVIHGLWQGSIKGDTEAKIEQSKKILALAEMFEGRKIICGDFNLLPHTQSLQMLANRYQNLIQTYNIQNTRSSLYTKELRFADYAFADKSIQIKNFSVPNIEVSDHLPLVIEFD